MTAQTVITRRQHPCAGMTKAQRQAFEDIAISLSPMCSQRVLDVLLKRGLIVRDQPKVLGRDSFGPITVAQYAVPLSYHQQWCAWCAEQKDGRR